MLAQGQVPRRLWAQGQLRSGAALRQPEPLLARPPDVPRPRQGERLQWALQRELCAQQEPEQVLCALQERDLEPACHKMLLSFVLDHLVRTQAECSI